MVVNTNIFRHLVFGGVDSADYGIYVNGDAVYNAPEREVNMITIPGRNGQLALDMGRFENIEITYPCGTFGKTQEEFREAISAFRNAILSQKGYQRLEDSYHPDEFRKAVYMSGLEAEPVVYNHAAEFELRFNCQPQRWLNGGEYDTQVPNGTPLNNPTLFDSRPLFKFGGNGLISLNGQDIEVPDQTMGKVVVTPPFLVDGADSASKTVTMNTDLFNSGDTLTIPSFVFQVVLQLNGLITGISGELYYTNMTDADMSGTSHKNNYYYINLRFPKMIQVIETGTSVYSNVYQTLLEARATIGGYTRIYRIYAKYTISRDSASAKPSLRFDLDVIPDSESEGTILSSQANIFMPDDVYIDSTQALTADTVYIDCETGEVYKVVGDTRINLNSKIELGSDLPALIPGDNTVFHAGTITNFQVVPRWWKI